MKYAAATLAAAIVALAGCEKSEPTDTTPPASQNYPSSQDKLVDSSQSAAHKTAIGEWRMQLELAESNINDLRQHSRVPQVSPADKTELDQMLKSLESQAGQLRTQLDDFKESDAMTWSTFSGDISTKMTRLKTDVRQATDKFLNGAANQPVPAPTAPSNPPGTPQTPPQNPATPPTPPQNPSPPVPTPDNPGTPPSTPPQPAPGPDVPPTEPPNPR